MNNEWSSEKNGNPSSEKSSQICSKVTTKTFFLLTQTAGVASWQLMID